MRHGWLHGSLGNEQAMCRCGHPSSDHDPDDVCQECDCEMFEYEHEDDDDDDEGPVGIPENAVVTARVSVVQYIDPDGTHFWTTHEGDVPLSTFLGLLDLAKSEMIRRFG